MFFIEYLNKKLDRRKCVVIYREKKPWQPNNVRLRFLVWCIIDLFGGVVVKKEMNCQFERE